MPPAKREVVLVQREEPGRAIEPARILVQDLAPGRIMCLLTDSEAAKDTRGISSHEAALH
jgi:hypothetical protein